MDPDGRWRHEAFVWRMVCQQSFVAMGTAPDGDCRVGNRHVNCQHSSLLWRSICGIGNSSPQTSLQCLSTINILSDEGKILIRSWYLKGYTAKRLTDEFPEKSWTKRGVNKLFKKLWDTGTVNRQPRQWQTVQCRNRYASSSEVPAVCHWHCSADCQVKCMIENTFLSIKKTKSVVYCGNFWSRSLARLIWAAPFASVSSCARHLLKYFRCRSLQIISDTDD